jgi:hypothetical protein
LPLVSWTIEQKVPFVILDVSLTSVALSSSFPSGPLVFYREHIAANLCKIGPNSRSQPNLPGEKLVILLFVLSWVDSESN